MSGEGGLLQMQRRFLRAQVVAVGAHPDQVIAFVIFVGYGVGADVL